MHRSFRVILLIMAGMAFSSPAFARYHRYRPMSARGGGGNSVECMADALAGEADGSAAGMYDVGKVIMARLARGQGGSICSIVWAPGQFVGAPNGARKGGAVKALARKVAAQVIARRMVGQYTQFRTAGYAPCGVTSHGNTYFNSCGGGGRRSRYASRSRRTRYSQRITNQQWAFLMGGGSEGGGTESGTGTNW